MFVNGLLGILTGIAMVALATNSFQADAAGVMGPGSTAGILILLGLGLAGLGIRGRKKIFQGTPPDGRYLALGRRANMNEDVLKGKWNEIKGRVKENWGKLTDDDLTAVEGKKEKLLGLLQQKYGYAKDKAEKEYKDFIGRYKGK